jgi:hypothetical protein
MMHGVPSSSNIIVALLLLLSLPIEQEQEGKKPASAQGVAKR